MPRVMVADWNGENQDGFASVAEEVLLPEVGRDIVLSVPHAMTTSPIEEDGKFHVFIWSSPQGKRPGEIVPETIWGIRVDCRDSHFLPSGQGVSILEDGGYVVAELVGDSNLYIHHDICHRGTEEEIQIFKRLLEEVVVILRERSLFAKSMLGLSREERQVLHTEQLVALGLQNFKAQMAEQRQEAERVVEESQGKVSWLQRSIMIEVRKAQAAERALQKLGDQDQDADWEKTLEQKLQKEFEIIRGLPEVRKVSVDRQVVTVTTRTICAHDSRSNLWHELGKFQIGLDTGSGTVNFQNKTRRVDGFAVNMHAPHVFSKGNACWGDAESSMTELLANLDLSSAVILAIRFLQTPNTGDCAGVYVSRWPLAEDQQSAQKGWLE